MLLEGLPARPCSLVEGLGLVLGECAREVVPPHLFDYPIKLGRVPCEGNSVAYIVR
jgi:hypothetical protein